MESQKNNNHSEQLAKLRQQAEAALSGAGKLNTDEQSVDEMHHLIAELQVHQIELEMQNDELRKAQAQLAAEREKYADLYNFAPVAYFTLDDNDVIQDLNLAAAELLGHEPKYLRKRPIAPYISPESLEKFIQHRRAALDTHTSQTCELAIRRRNGTHAIAQVRTVVISNDSTGFPLWRSVMIDITEQKKAEVEIAFHASLLEQVHNGVIAIDFNNTILHWNHFAEELYQWTPEETIGKNIIDLLSPEEIKETAQQNFADLKRESHWEGDFIVKRKDGSAIPVHITNNYLTDPLGNNAGFIWINVDITERKQSEQMTQLRLELLEFAASHSLDEFLMRALDEVERITESQISFYHFVEPDQKTLSLQAWSTRTQNEFCKMEGKGLHYDMDVAGVWVECAYLRKPVIHNDYASLPNRKGMPSDHAAVTRELVVPILREGKIVSILGVGNKPAFYQEADVETVSFLADVTWEIVQRKRAEGDLHEANVQLSKQLKEIEQLQIELKKQALRDPLTGLHNRRYLAEAIKTELARCNREKGTLSVIAMDIDHFKRVNDTFGHQAGDKFLQTVAMVLKNHVRESDIACRYGGEEFLLLLPGATIPIATKRAEELREGLSKIRIQHEGKTIHATMSLGVAAYPQHALEAEELLIKADKALYKSKQGGRNKVTVWLEKQG